MKFNNFSMICAIFLLIGWTACINHSTNITFNNESNLKIDSVHFILNNYVHKMESISPFSKKNELVSLDSIRLNNHDLIVRANVYLKDSLFRGALNYNDLYGGLSSGYVLTLKKDSTTSLISVK